MSFQDMPKPIPACTSIKLNVEHVCEFHVLRYTTMRRGPNKSSPVACGRLLVLETKVLFVP
jgi:hypothetical protein